MKLTDNYYPCFLGNGLDALLIGYNGSMEPDKVGVDRCAWYKSDRYYPEDRLVQTAGRFPTDRPLEHAAGSGWYDVAPLGHTWYEVLQHGQPLQILSSKQRFEPHTGLLHSGLDFGPLQAQVVTFLHPRESVLVERYEFSEAVDFRAWMAPGIWVEDGWDTDPFYQVRMDPSAASGWYDLGETHGNFFLHLDPAQAGPVLTQENARGLQSHGRVFTKYFAILDDRQGPLGPAGFRRILAPGYETLLAETVQFWQAFFARSSVSIPDAQFQAFYDASLYHFKAAQNRLSGGLPVNNLRRTWSSHVFWDSYYLQRALLEANHLDESREGVHFFERTVEAARKHARDEFGAPGLKWDWEITHDGRKAYGTLLHMKFQVHNNGSYANELFQHYRFTQDLAYLGEVYPLLEGLATFFLEGIVIKTERGWEIGPLVGVNESPIKVRNEAMNLSASIVILEHCADAARLLGRESEFHARCRQVAAGLRRILDGLYNGKFFIGAEDENYKNRPSAGMVYPMAVIAFDDPRAVSTTQAVIGEGARESRQRNGHYYNFPWHWGVLGTILAFQGRADQAWEAIESSRPAICEFGGMTEVMEDNDWNMQYFCTAQAAVVTALHSLLLQAGTGDEVHVFPAVPAAWQTCSFERLLANGLEVSAGYEAGRIRGQVKNIAPLALERTVRFGSIEKHVQLKPGECCAFETP